MRGKIPQYPHYSFEYWYCFSDDIYSESHTKITDLGLLIDSGFKSATGNQEIDLLLLSRGGIESMMPTVSLIILTLSLAGSS